LLKAEDRENIIKACLQDLGFAAKTSDYPDVIKEIAEDPRIMEAFKDPVFAAVLLANQKWLVNAPKHQEFLRDNSTRIVAACGRGWGKSLTISLKAVYQFLLRIPKVEILIVSSSQRQSMQMFDYCEKHVMASDILNMYTKPGRGGRHTRTILKLGKPFEGRIEALPCSPNKLRGKHPDVMLVDEASIIPTEMLASELIMMLTKPDVRLIMAGTPFGFDHPFRTAFNNPNYRVYHEPSYNSPLVSKENLEEWRQIMTQEQWQREVEAKWVEVLNSYFPEDLIRECVDPELGFIEDLEKAEIPRGPVFAGLDLGKQQDFSVLAIIIIDGEKLKHFYLYQFPLGTKYSEVIAHVARANQIFRFSKIIVDKSGVGDPIVEELENIGLRNVEGIVLTDTNKEEILSNLKIQMEQKRLAITDYMPLIMQMNEQQYEYLKPKTAQERIHLKFKHPSGHHDDMLWALALAVYGAREKPDRSRIIVKPF